MKLKILIQLRRIKKVVAKLTYSFVDEINFRAKYFSAAILSREFRYQPIFEFKRALRRETSTTLRWDAIWNSISSDLRLKKEGGAVLDIGCNMGFFSFNLARKGFFCLGIDGEAIICEFNNLLKNKNHSGLSVVFEHYFIDKKTVGVLPSFDIILFLGVWHHITKTHTLEESKTILKKLYQKCNSMMFFETGYESIELYNEYAEDQQEKDRWVYNILKECCPGAQIEMVGYFEERDASGGKPLGASRPMYVIKKAYMRSTTVDA